METMFGPSPYSVDSQADADLYSMPLDRLLYRYVEEIFSNYLDQTATLPEVLDEIKAIIAILIASKDKQLCQFGGYMTGKTTEELGQRR